MKNQVGLFSFLTLSSIHLLAHFGVADENFNCSVMKTVGTCLQLEEFAKLQEHNTNLTLIN